MSIIALTALNLPGHRERCLDAGADEYLSKPISPHTLTQAIEAQVHQKATGTDYLMIDSVTCIIAVYIPWRGYQTC